MTVQTLAAEIGVDPGDVEGIARWLTTDEALDDDTLKLELRAMLDPAGQRTERLASACSECGRLPGPNPVLVGWHPCTCGGHSTSYCRADADGCGHTRHEPPIDPERCSDAPFGFSG
jgi:hypothetical protein